MLFYTQIKRPEHLPPYSPVSSFHSAQKICILFASASTLLYFLLLNLLLEDFSPHQCHSKSPSKSCFSRTPMLLLLPQLIHIRQMENENHLNFYFMCVCVFSHIKNKACVCTWIPRMVMQHALHSSRSSTGRYEARLCGRLPQACSVLKDILQGCVSQRVIWGPPPPGILVWKVWSQAIPIKSKFLGWGPGICLLNNFLWGSFSYLLLSNNPFLAPQTLWLKE